MSSPKISIIAPVFNSARYLANFITSVIEQSFTDWELLLVDDGSTDSGNMVCQSFGKEDARIVFIQKAHGGVSSARNEGIRRSRGEWLFFADSDDLLLPDCLSILYKNTNSDVDLVSASYQRYVDGVFIPKTIIKESAEYESASFFEELSQVSTLNARWLERYLWTKLFRKSIIEDYSILFDEALSYREDVLFLFSYLVCCKKSIIGIDEDVYCYFRRSDGLAMTGVCNLNLDFFYSLIKCYSLVRKEKRFRVAKNYLRKEITAAYSRAYRIIGNHYKPHEFKIELGRIDKELRHVSLFDYVLVKSKSFLRPLYRRIKSTIHNEASRL